MKLLVANRGEIACRIFETARIMGLSTVAVYSTHDTNARHVMCADEAHLLEGATLGETYLNIDQILTIAKKTKATLIHPGYGFLSEKASFAKEVLKHKFKWVGPLPESIEKMGSKIDSKILVDKLKIRTLPWAYVKAGDKLTEKDWLKKADDIGYPLLVKASGGGGGKGMKLVHDKKNLMSSLESAMREASSAFADSSVFLEKYLERSKHIEVQVLADQEGHVIHLMDRECSAQRRHQKVVEEAPAPDLSDDTRQELHKAAVKLAKEINYHGAGTVEFLVDPAKKKDNWYFLEMNTRLQVEHPVTEWITGLDLVEEQIRVALGEKLRFSQQDISPRGHAIECRLYAEDPFHGFMPTPGPVTKLAWPLTRHTRIDTGINEGGEISPHYDPMVAKVSTWGINREQARLQMLEALGQTIILGFTHNIAFLKKLLETTAFIKNTIFTNSIEKDLLSQLKPQPTVEELKILVSALLMPTRSGENKKTGGHHRPSLFSVINL